MLHSLTFFPLKKSHFFPSIRKKTHHFLGVLVIFITWMDSVPCFEVFLLVLEEWALKDLPNDLDERFVGCFFPPNKMESSRSCSKEVEMHMKFHRDTLIYENQGSFHCGCGFFFYNFSLFGVTSQSCGYGLDVKRLESAFIPALHVAPLRLTHYTVYYLSILAPDGGSGQVPLKRPTSLPSHHQSENLNSGILDCSAEQHTPI